MIRANTLCIFLAFCIYYTVFAETDLNNVQCPNNGGVFWTQTIRAFGVNCTRLYIRLNQTAIITWNGRGITVLDFDVQIATDDNGKLFTVFQGYARRGVFKGFPVLIGTYPLPDVAMNCSENGVSSVSGGVDLYVDPDNDVWKCENGKSLVTFTPPITATNKNVDIKIRFSLGQCSGNCSPNSV